MKPIYAFIILFFGFIYCNSQSAPGVLHCLTLGTPDGSQTQYNQIGYYINNSPIDYGGCQTTPAIIVAVIDSFCQPWNTCDHNFGQSNWFVLTSGTCANPISGYGACRNRPDNYFIFHLNDTSQVINLARMLDSIPNDFYILAYTWYTFSYTHVPLFVQAIQYLGGTQISTLQDSMPYIFFIKKGDLSTLQEVSGTSIGDTLNLSANITCNTSSVSEIVTNNFSIYPNPVNDKIYLTNSDKYSEWKIFDVTGQIILSGKITEENFSIDVNNFSRGFYFLFLGNNVKSVNTGFIRL